MRLRLLSLALLFCLAKSGLGENVYDVLEYGAKADGVTLSTEAIQKAIDECTAAGGGTVKLTAGKYLTGTLALRDNVRLQLDEGAMLLGSPNLEDYPENTPRFQSLMTERHKVSQSLIYAERVSNVALVGKGTIDGQGKSFKIPKRGSVLRTRPFLIRMIECKGVLVEDVTLQNSASWTESYLACDDVTIRGVQVIGHAMRNNDGIDIDSCQNVHISNCHTSTDDDGMCFKGMSLRPTKNVTVENCRFYSYCNSLKYGTDSQGGFENVQIRNVELGRPDRDAGRKILGVPEGITGISLEIVDGGHMKDVVIEDVKIRGTRAPIYIVLGDRGRHLSDKPRMPPGTLRDVTIRNVTAEADGNLGCPIIGLPDHPIENLKLSNLRISFPGGGTAEDRLRRFGEVAHNYPEATKYAARLPAYGLFCWHVKGLTLEDVNLELRGSDERPPIALEDCEDVTSDGASVSVDNTAEGIEFLTQETAAGSE